MSLPARVLLFASGFTFFALLFSFYPSYAASSGSVIINEVYYDVDSAHGLEGDNEWVELYNPTNSAVSISGWTIADNSSSRLIPEATISAKGFALITNKADTWGFWSIPNNVAKIALGKKIGNGLANGGDYLALKDAAGDIVDQISYGQDTTAFAPSCPDVKEGHSLERSPFGFDTDQALDFIDQTAPTPGAGYTPPVYSDQVLINEIMPNPSGSEVEGEYIELYNASDEDVDLDGWIVGDLTARKTIGDDFVLSSTKLPAKGFLVVYRKDSHIVLNNGGDTITLFDPNEVTVDSIAYPKIEEDWVYQRYPDGGDGWSKGSVPTAGDFNQPRPSVADSSDVSADSAVSSGIELTFSVDDSDLKVNQSFDVNLGFKNAQPSHDYYVKVRLGLVQNKLNKGRTYNSFYNAWLADNSAWANFPDLFTDSQGTWGSGTISAKVASGNPAGEYFIVVRLRDAKTGKNYDAAVKTIHLGEEDVSEGQRGEEAAVDVTDPGVVLGAFRELPQTGASTLVFGYWGSFLGLILRRYA